MAMTYSERPNGVIRICIPNQMGDDGVLEYLMAHEMVHAQQNCQLSNIQVLERVGLMADTQEKGAAGCCAAEREAYFTQCKMMAQDGILDAVSISIDQCASTFANNSCAAFRTPEMEDKGEWPCSTGTTDSQDVFERINTYIQENRSSLNLPSSCAALVSNPTPRIAEIYNSLPLSCAPGCQARYENTIGNNLCYTGQCIEETHEFARAVPGRAPLTEIDQAFPWDACILQDPEIGAVATPPALLGPKLPTYNPEDLLSTMDRSLCQLNGLPYMSPPVLCGFDPLLTIGLGRSDAFAAAIGVATGEAEYGSRAQSLEASAGGIGARIAADMLVDYLRPASRQLADIIDMMRTTLSQVGDVSLPDTMCPRRAPDDLCSELQ